MGRLRLAKIPAGSWALYITLPFNQSMELQHAKADALFRFCSRYKFYFLPVINSCRGMQAQGMTMAQPHGHGICFLRAAALNNSGVHGSAHGSTCKERACKHMEWTYGCSNSLDP